MFQQWSYLGILKDARLVAVQKHSRDLKVRFEFWLKTQDAERWNENRMKEGGYHQSNPPYMHEIGVHAPGCPRSDGHRDAMLLQFNTAVMIDNWQSFTCWLEKF